ncbi:MAG: NADH-quinone oxidoreductase subunit J [Actinomycetales bacterium]
MTGLDILLAGVGGLALLSALAAVLSRQVVHAALWLVVSLGSLAAFYLAMGAEVVGLVQLLVYVGAVVVLLLFALMLTRAPITPSSDLSLRGPRVVLSAVVAAGVSALVLFALLGLEPMRVPGLGAHGGPTAIGAAVFTSWVLPFELISILLLAALVAAVSLSRPRATGASAGEEGQPGEGVA